MGDKNTKKLREIINQIKMTPVTAPLVSIHTINHLLVCVHELEKVAEELEAETEGKADEDHNQPE